MNFDPLLIFNAIIATKVNQSSFLEQCESGSNFILARDVRKPQIYVTLTSGSKFISHAYLTRDKVSFIYFTGSKFIPPSSRPQRISRLWWVWSDRTQRTRAYLYIHGIVCSFYDVHMNTLLKIGICNLGIAFPWFHISPSFSSDTKRKCQNEVFSDDPTCFEMGNGVCNFSSCIEIFHWP